MNANAFEVSPVLGGALTSHTLKALALFEHLMDTFIIKASIPEEPNDATTTLTAAYFHIP